MVKWLIIKTTFKIHPLFFLVGLICFLTGHFKLFIIFTLIIIIHELGHIVAAIICGWKIDRIILLPFGGYIIFDELINKDYKQELFITILGPIFQIISLFIIKEYRDLNLSLLLFNLLPIIPLDGSKLLSILLNMILPFKKSYLLLIYISLILAISLIRFNLVLLIILLFIILEITKSYLKKDYIFNKFLLERYIYKFNFKRYKYVKNINNFYKFRKNIIYSKTEHEILKNLFDKSNRVC